MCCRGALAAASPLLSLAESSVPLLVAKRQQDLQLLLSGLNDFLFCTKVSVI